MRLHKVHLVYWQQRRAPAPRWAEGLGATEPAVSVHACVNAHAGAPGTVTFACDNLLVLCRSWRKRGAVLEVELARVAACPATVVDPNKRAALALRWLARIVRDRQRRVRAGALAIVGRAA